MLCTVLHVYIILISGFIMTNTKGYRRGTRYMFSRQFRKKGVIPLSTYMKTYKRGDIVDIKASVVFLSLHPLCGGGELLFLLSPPAATCFCSHSKTPNRIISKYLQYAYWPWGICLVNFTRQFPQQNPRCPPKSYGAH